MDWTTEELSGHYRADGAKGGYWIMELTWTYLQRVTPTPAGPTIEKLGTFYGVEDAMKMAELIDKSGIEFVGEA